MSLPVSRLHRRAATAALVLSVGTACNEEIIDPPLYVSPAAIQLAPDSLVLDQPGDTSRFNATALDGAGNPLGGFRFAWTSSDTSRITVDSTGLLTAVATGEVTITARVGNVDAQAGARVVPELTMAPAGPTSHAGAIDAQVSLAVQVRDLLGATYQGAAVTWAADAASGSIQSSDSTRSDPAGFAGAVWRLGTAAGQQRARARLSTRGTILEVVFTATVAPGVPVSAALVADSILLSARGETAYLAPTYRDAHQNSTPGSGVTWASRAPAVATVAADGLVTGQSAGTTWIVGSFGSSTDSVLVTVVMRGAITITFDDGFLTAFTNAWPALQELGLPANVAVNPAQVGFPAYMTKTQLDEVHAAGWSIVSHTMTHDSLPTLSTGELDYELRQSRAWIDAQGYNGSNVFIVPFHVWSTRERAAVGALYEAARGSSANAVVPDSLVAWRPNNPYDLTGIEADALPYTTSQGRDQLRALLQRTVDEGTFLDVFLHHLPAGNVQAFRDMLLVIADFRQRVLPYHQLYPRFARTVF